MSMPPKPPPRMKLSQVPGYVDRKTGNVITKMTVYNWTNKGVKGEKLRFILGRSRPKGFPDTRLTTAPWVDDFLARMDAARRGT